MVLFQGIKVAAINHWKVYEGYFMLPAFKLVSALPSFWTILFRNRTVGLCLLTAIFIFFHSKPSLKEWRKMVFCRVFAAGD
jgi:hypothetical protein